MPTYKEGHLFILGSGPAPPDTLPDAPPKHWFELHVLPAGLRLVHFPEECDYENIVEDLNEDEFRAEPWAIPGEEGGSRGLIIATKKKTYYLRTGPAPSADSDEKWWIGHRRDCAEWLARLGYEPPEEGEPPKEAEPEPEPEEEAEEPLWKREGRKRGRLLVVASCPELGTRDLQIGDDTRFQEEVMTVGFSDCSDHISSRSEPDPGRDAVGFSDCSDRITARDEPDQEKGQEPLTTPVQVLLYLLVVGGSQSLLFSFPLLLFLLKFLKIYIGVAGVKG